SSATINRTICANQLPYTWRGKSYAEAGTYTDTLSNAAGCDSVITLVLSVNAVLESSASVTICSNQLPYSWNGKTYRAAGTYKDTLRSAAGCDSVAMLILGVNPVLTSSINVTICASELPYRWNAKTYREAGTYTDTLKTEAGCDSVVRLALAVRAAAASTINQVVCSTQLPYQWNGRSYTAAGTYTDTLKSATGCDSVVTLVLVVNPIAISKVNATVCANQLPYAWNGRRLTASGTYYDTLRSVGGCDSVAILTLAVKEVLYDTVRVAVCQNQLPYSWHGKTYTAAGTFTDTLTSALGCDSLVALVLSVNPVPVGTDSATVCSGSLPYSWHGRAYRAAGTYTDTVHSVAGCDSLLTLVLQVRPVVTSTTNISICQNQLPYSWNGQSYTAAGTYQDTSNSAEGCDSIAILNLEVKPVASSTVERTICASSLPYIWNNHSYRQAGTYSDTLRSLSGCDSVVTLNLRVIPVSKSTVRITVCSNELPYRWNNKLYREAGIYKDTLQAATGCDSIINFELTVQAIITSTIDTSICATDLPYRWHGALYREAGVYKDTLISVSGCDSIITLNISIKPVPESTTAVSVCSSELPYSWNGKRYTTAGTFTDTLSSSAGCDSVAVLELSVRAAAQSTTTTS
ncbi:MAG: hypothetical protein INR73_29105, partial [Williamsia sp.]|nr:hypothetical protein [Williamsia sp.]